MELTILTDKPSGELIERWAIELNERGEYRSDGKRRLAYSVMGKEFAHYYYIEFERKRDEQVKRLVQKLEYSDAVLRFLLTRKAQNGE